MADFREQRDILKAVNEELGKSSNLVKQATSEVTKLESITKNLQFNAEGVARMSDKQLQNAESQAKVALEELRTKSKSLQKEKGIVDLAGENLDLRLNLTEEERAFLKAAKDGFTVEKKTVELAGDELRIRKGVNKSMGLTGVLAKSLSRTLGIDIGDHLEDARDKAEDVNRKFEESDKNLGDIGKKIVGNILVGFKNMKGLASAFIETFTSTEAIMVGLVKSFLQFNNANRESRQLTGQSADNFDAMNDSILNAADQVQTITALSRELGINVNAAFSPETIAEASEFTNLMGISEGATAKLALQAEATGQSLEDVKDAAFDTVIGLAKSGKGAVNVQQVIEDTAEVSGKLQATLGKNPEALARAAGEARALGLSLKEMEAVADGLLNFQSSIEAEMEAELLTGKQINLEQARQFALMNDMEGLTKEIGKNQEIIQAFSTGNRLQQQAIEKSLGLSSEQISQMIYKQQVAAGMSEEQAMKAAGINEEEMERLAIQEQFQKSLEKLTMAAAPLVEQFASLLDNTTAMKFVLGGIAAIKLGGLIGTFKGIYLQLARIIPLLVAKVGLQTFGVGLAAITAATLVGIAAFRAATKPIKDGVIDSQGGLVVSGPRGSYSLDTNDTIVANRNGVIAGTNLGGGGGSNAAMMERMDRLIAATEKGSTITMDGNLVGRSVADNTSALG